MKKKTVIFILLTGLIAIIYKPALAQSAQAPAEAPKEAVFVSGLMYLQWIKELERPSEGERRNGFDIQRVYLNFTYRIDEIWSTRATLDVGNDNGTDQRYQAYLKFGYVQAASDFGLTRLTFQFGLIGTSVLGFVDKQSDYRWINQNFIDGANLVLHNQKNPGQLSMRVPDGTIKGQSLDSSADLGMGLCFSVKNILSVDLQLTNGDGFKKTNDMTVNDDGKAYLAMITLTPFSGLAIAGFYRYQITDDTARADNYTSYYGTMLVYQFQGIRIGGIFLLAEVSSMAPGSEPMVAKYRLMDFFIMANMKSFVGIPVLLAGRYVAGATKYKEGYTVNGLTAEATVWAAGIGWQFNDRVRVIAYFENQKSISDDIPSADWSHPARNVWIKSEVSF